MVGQPIQLFRSKGHWDSAVFALSGAMQCHQGPIGPWWTYRVLGGTAYSAVYFDPNGAMGDRTWLKCDLGGIRTHALRKNALTGTAQ